MSESTPPDGGPSNRTDEHGSESDAADRRSDGGVVDRDLPVPLPAEDEVTVELVRDAVSVSRGELSDERFSDKYGLGPSTDPSN